MRVSRFVTPALAGVLVLCSVPVATAQPPPDERRSGWYVGGGAGVNWASDINQRGSNRDHLCYPRYACFDEKPRPEQSGYRWAYDLRTAVGAPFELSTGFDFEHLRLELAFAQRVNGIEQVFRSVSDYAGNLLDRRRGGTVTSDSEFWIDNLTVRTLAVSAYYDFRKGFGRFAPYVGVGLGPAFAELRGSQYEQHYWDPASNDGAYDPPLSHYKSRQDADMADTVLGGHLHGGADFSVADRTALGVRVTYTVLGDLEYTGTYQEHPLHAVDPNFSNHTVFTGTRYWTLLFTVRYALGS